MLLPTQRQRPNRYHSASLESSASSSDDGISIRPWLDGESSPPEQSSGSPRPRSDSVLCNVILASRSDWSRVTAMIDEAGPPLHYVDSYGKTVLHYAIRGRAPPEIVELLLSKGLDANRGDVDGWTPLHLFVRLWKGSDEGVLQVLLKHGADPNKQNNAGESSVFLAAAHCVPPSIMRHLLSAAGNPNTKNSLGETPLIIAAKFGDLDLETVRELLKTGADPWIRDLSGNNALDWGRAKGHDALVKQMRRVRYEGKPV